MSCTITPLTEHTGAEVRGVDLREPIDDATHAALNRAFVNHHVLVIRDQDFSPSNSNARRRCSARCSSTTKSSITWPGIRTCITSPTTSS